MTWHLRDTSRLREVFVVEPMARYSISESYWEWITKLLLHLSVSASELRSLNIIPPKEDRCCGRMAVVLPLIGALSQLESLALRFWWYDRADIRAIPHLTRLQRLEVTLTDRQNGLSSHHMTFSFHIVPKLCIQDSHATL